MVSSAASASGAGWQNAAGPLLPSTDQSVLSGLEPNTRYDIRVTAAFLGGREVMSAVLPTWTLSRGKVESNLCC